MSLYEIRSPCERFFFSTDSSTPYPTSEGCRVFVKNDTLYDYDLIPFFENGFYIPDLMYAASLYMAGVRGMPSGEYEVKIGNSVKQISLPLKVSDIGINHSKCKLLCSQMPYSDRNVTINLGLIGTATGTYAALECDNSENFDADLILPRIRLGVPLPSDIRALLVLSPSADGYLMRSLPFRGCTSVRDSSAIAAAYTFLASRGGASHITVLYDGVPTACTSSAFGLSLFCLCEPLWHKL